MLLDWDCRLEPESVAAGIYNKWEQQLGQKMLALMVPAEARQFWRALQIYKVINWLVMPDGKFGEDPLGSRDDLLVESLMAAVEELEEKLGPDMKLWQYGQIQYKHVYIKHPLSNAVSEEWRKKLNVGPAPRGGNSFTVNNTASEITRHTALPSKSSSTPRTGTTASGPMLRARPGTRRISIIATCSIPG